MKDEEIAHPYDWRLDSTFENFFNVGTSTAKRKINPFTVRVWEEEFKDAFEGKIAEVRGQSQAVKYASQLYKTNFSRTTCG